MGKTSIAWTDATWNPTAGCTRCSEGCRNCYAFALHDRRHAAHLAGKSVPPQYARPFRDLQLLPGRLDDPLHWRTPRRVFVNSVSDLFHKDVPDDFLLRCFDVMRRCTWAGGQNCGRIGGDGHTFQALTKRAGRMQEFCSRLRWDGERVYLGDVGGRLLLPINRGIWLGVSAEDQRRADERISLLLQTPVAVRFVSCEPLLGPVDLSPWVSGLSWVIVGGESGPGARPMCLEWARSLVTQCRGAGVPVFVKQVGSVAAREMGSRDPKGGRMEDWPVDLRAREFPAANSV